MEHVALLHQKQSDYNTLKQEDPTALLISTRVWKPSHLYWAMITLPLLATCVALYTLLPTYPKAELHDVTLFLKHNDLSDVHSKPLPTVLNCLESHCNSQLATSLYEDDATSLSTVSCLTRAKKNIFEATFCFNGTLSHQMLILKLCSECFQCTLPSSANSTLSNESCLSIKNNQNWNNLRGPPNKNLIPSARITNSPFSPLNGTGHHNSSQLTRTRTFKHSQSDLSSSNFTVKYSKIIDPPAANEHKQPDYSLQYFNSSSYRNSQAAGENAQHEYGKNFYNYSKYQTQSAFENMTSVTIRGNCVLIGETANESITFQQSINGGPTIMKGQITSFTTGLLGFQIHILRDRRSRCSSASAGANLSPGAKSYGTPNDEARHFCYSGNAKASGVVDISLEERFVSLVGLDSIIGSAVVLYSDPDGLGARDDEALCSGSRGTRLACGVIGIESN
jgi:Cu/Zn superoxide dismutase